MFLHLSVILFTGGGVCQTPSLRRYPHQRRPLQWRVHILLEYVLVCLFNFWFPWAKIEHLKSSVGGEIISSLQSRYRYWSWNLKYCNKNSSYINKMLFSDFRLPLLYNRHLDLGININSWSNDDFECSILPMKTRNYRNKNGGVVRTLIWIWPLRCTNCAWMWILVWPTCVS